MIEAREILRAGVVKNTKIPKDSNNIQNFSLNNFVARMEVSFDLLTEHFIVQNNSTGNLPE